MYPGSPPAQNMNSDPDIPEGSAVHPRWLLDIDEWIVYPYKDVKELVETDPEGYGIVSYTWGMWSNVNYPAPDPPQYYVNEEKKNLPWSIPTIEGLTLSHARKIMKKCLRTKFVWWDWMCVPQGESKQLGELLTRVKGEEVANQMIIYRNASKGFVWLHRTQWKSVPSHEMRHIESLRLIMYLKDAFDLQNNFEDTLNELRICLLNIQTKEPWLTSGWTLQEGVLLQNSELRDCDGEGLSGDFRSSKEKPNDGRRLKAQPHNLESSNAAVEHLSVPATNLADGIARVLLKHSEGWTLPSLKRIPQGTLEIVKQGLAYLSDDQGRERYKFVAKTFTNLIRSGLVSYWPGQHTVLYLLSGVASRRFRSKEDKCWALIGALELKGLEPWYNDEKDLDKVKRSFFKPLLKKYQWELLLVPEVEDKNYKTMPWPERIVHGGVLPLSLFFIKEIYTDLPGLAYDAENDEIICTPKSSGCLTSSTVRGFVGLQQDVFVRRYRQKNLDPEESGESRGFIEVDQIKREKREGLIYLPVMDIEIPDTSCLGDENEWEKIRNDLEEKRKEREKKKEKGDEDLPERKSPGLRCAEFHEDVTRAGAGYFRGIVDLWGLSSSYLDISYPEFRIVASKPSVEETGRCVMA